MTPRATVPPVQLAKDNARRLTLFGMLLQILHVLFGVTALLGIIITQTHKHTTAGSVYESHLRWQFVTFWMGLAGYVPAFYLWITQSTPWLVVAVFILVAYRIIVSCNAWARHRPIDRWF